MKKIFTLVLTVSLATASFAQFNDRQGNQSRDDVAYNDRNDKWDNSHHHDRSDYFKKREMEKQISAINREYGRKINNVRDNKFMHSFRKQRLIKELESRRNAEIKAVYAKFNDRRYGMTW